MRDENARLGVETTMRRDRIVRSATESRSNWLIDQWHSARPDRNALEKTWLGGPRMGSSSQCPGKNLAGWSKDGEQFSPAGRTIQLGLTSGAQTHTVFGRNEPAMIHYHRSMQVALRH